MDPVSSIDPKVGQVAEGKVLTFQTEDAIRTEELITFEFPSKNQLIEIDTHEFSAVCPFSGLPDIARIIIKYYPSTNKALELKALKYYFLSFRNVGIYQEGVTYRMYIDLCKVLGHLNVTVITQYNTRGGIDVTCTEGGLQTFSIEK
jgi:7-cyano-7-deazaguanine reductase